MTKFFDKIDLELTGIWYEWQNEGSLLGYQLENTPFIILFHKNWDFKLNKIIKIVWIENEINYGQILCNYLGKTDPNLTINRSLNDALNNVIKNITSYSKKTLKWTPIKKMKINNLESISSYTQGDIEFEGFHLHGRISIYILINEGHLISLIISGAYVAKSPWGNREPILRNCVWPIIIRKNNELKLDKDVSEIKKDTSLKKTYQTINVFKKIQVLENKFDKIVSQVQKLESKIDLINDELKKTIDHFDEGFDHLINKILELRSDFLIFSTDTFSKIIIEKNNKDS
ncbi:MAG: hypothetical protein ACTSPY_02160 [Candidatus Helarchaeota archaeon]